MRPAAMSGCGSSVDTRGRAARPARHRCDRCLEGIRRRKEAVRRWRVLLVTTILCAALALLASSPAQASSTLAKLRHARHDLRAAKLHLRQYRALLRAMLAAQAAADSGSGSQTTTVATPAPMPDASPSPLTEPSVSTTPDPSASATPSPDPSPIVSPSPNLGVPATVAAPVASLTVEELRAKIVRAKVRVHRRRHTVLRLARRLAVERATARGYYVPLIRDVAGRNGISPAGLYAMMILESGGRATAVSGGGAYMGLFQYSWSTWHGAWNGWRTSSIFDPAAQIRATARALRRGYGPSMWPNTYWRAF
jgi:soluble lytic murein transglycosylase-like protein